MPAAKMISEKQLAANRLNAQKSTGPQTEEGKKISSQNGYTHGLTAQILLLTPDEQARHDQFTADYAAALNPETFIETDLAQAIAEAVYRLRRAQALDINMFAAAKSGEESESDSAIADANTFLRDARQFNLLTIYEQRIHRNMEKDVKALNALQAERKATRLAALEQAELLATASLAEGSIYDPATDFPVENGFSFSIAEINRSIDRKRRIAQAKALCSPQFKTKRTLAQAA